MSLRFPQVNEQVNNSHPKDELQIPMLIPVVKRDLEITTGTSISSFELESSVGKAVRF